MILEHVVLENVRSHGHTEIVFGRGTTLLSGDVGSGKSSVLMGVEFALFGLGPQKAEALLSKGSREGYVELRFSVDGKPYEIRRALRRQVQAAGASAQQDPKGSYLTEDGRKVPLSTLEMKQRILQILRFNEPAGPNSVSRIFRYAVFTPQEEMKVVLSDAKNRLETVRRAFGIEDYRTAADNARAVALEIRQRASELAGRASASERLAKSVEDLEEKVRGSEKAREEARGAAEAERAELDSLAAKRAELKSKEAEKAALERKLYAARSNAEEKSKRKNSIAAEIAQDEKEIAEASGQISSHRVPEKPTGKSLQQLDSEIRAMEGAQKEIAEARARIRIIEEEIAGAESQMGGRAGDSAQVLGAESDEAQKRAREAREAQKKAEERGREAGYEARRCRDGVEQSDRDAAESLQEGARCPTCENVITGEHLQKLKAERAEKRASLEAGAAEAEKAQRRSEAEAAEAKRKAEEMERLGGEASRLAELASKVSAKTAELAESKEAAGRLQGGGSLDLARELRSKLAEHEDAVKTRAMLEQRLERARNGMERRSEEMEAVKSEIAAAEAQRAQASAGLERFSGLDGEVSAADDSIAQSQERLTRALSRLAAEERGIEEGRAALERDKKSLAEAERCAKERDRHRDYETWIAEFFVRAMPEIEKKVLKEMYVEFNAAYRGWYKKLVDDETKRSYIDEDFAPCVEQDGVMQEVAYMSGGERTGVALAYRLALNSVLRKKTDILKSSLLILDEPTDGFSNSQMVKIKEMLDELDSEQVILVSHDPNLEGFADRVVRVRRDGDISKVEG